MSDSDCHPLTPHGVGGSLGGDWVNGATQASWDKNVILYLDDLLVLSHSEEAARRDTMAVINDCSICIGFSHQLGGAHHSPLPSRRLVNRSLDSATMTARL